MKFNKLIAALSTAAMLGSLAVVPVTASADEAEATETIERTVTVASDAGWYASGDTFYTPSAVEGQEGVFTYTSAESTIYKSTTKIALPGVSAGTSATVSVPVTIDEGAEFSNNGFYINVSGMSSKFNKAGSTTITQTFATDTYATNEAIELRVFIRNIVGTVTFGPITVTYTADVAAKIGDTPYVSLMDALNASASGDTITLLKDCDISSTARYIIGKKNLTIESENKTITVGNNSVTAGILLNEKDFILTFNNTNIKTTGSNAIASESGTIIVNGGTIEGNVFVNKGAKVTLNNVTVTGSILSGTGAISTITLTGTTTVGEIPEDGNFTLVDERPTPEPETESAAYEFTADKDMTFTTVSIDVTDVETQPVTLDTALSLEANGAVYVIITGVPTDVTINSVTLN